MSKLDNFLVSGNAMHGEKSGCLPRGKRAAIERRYPTSFFLPVCKVCGFRVSIPLAVSEAKAYSFATGGYGIFNMRTNWVCVPYTRKEVRHKQVQVQEFSGLGGVENCLLPFPAEGSNPEIWDLNSDAPSNH